MKNYGFNGLSGCVLQKIARQTKTLVGVYRNNQAGLDTSEPWSTVCETHSWVISHPTLKLAIYHSVTPDQWCEECMKIAEDKSCS